MNARTLVGVLAAGLMTADANVEVDVYVWTYTRDGEYKKIKVDGCSYENGEVILGLDS